MANKPTLPRGITLYKDTVGEKTYWRVRLGTRFLGKGSSPIKRAFPSHSEAVSFIKEEQARLFPHQESSEKTGLAPAVIAEVQVALARLQNRAGILEAVDFWLKHAAPVSDSPSVLEAIEALHREQQSQGLSSRHVSETRAKLKLIFQGLEKKKISEVKASDLEKARDREDKRGNPASASLRVKRVRYASILISWAIERGWIQPDRSPLRGVSRPRLRAQKVEILSVSDCFKLLETCREKLPDFLPCLALKLFAGLRNSEVVELGWEAIKESTIRVEKTKTDRARSVSISDNLRAWFPSDLPKNRKIFAWNSEIKNRVLAWIQAMGILQEKAEVEIPQNALRHSFGSYLYAIERDAGKVAFEMGNSPAVVRQHYADAVDKSDAERFWRLKPGDPGLEMSREEKLKLIREADRITLVARGKGQ